ncbi:MAG: helix-turn-helix domain-containing protein [Shewanella sp.]
MKVLRSNGVEDRVVLRNVDTVGKIDATRVIKIRQKLDISQGVLAKLLNSNVARIRAWEHGRVPTINHADAMLLCYLEKHGFQAYIETFGLKART